MRISRLVAVAALVACLPFPARATNHVTIAGSAATAEGACLDLYTVANRRWTSNYWPSAAPLAEGVCEEGDPHEHLTYNCTVVARRAGTLPSPEDPAVFRGSARIGTQTLYVVAIDRGTDEPDLVGLSTKVPRFPDLCGTSEVAAHPVAGGGYTMLITA